MRHACFLLLATCCCIGSAETPQMLTQLIQQGIVMTGDQAFPVPTPTLEQELDAEKRQEQLDDFAGPLGWKRFSRKSVSAPVSIDLKYLKDANGTRIGHDVHIAFIIHTPLDRLKDEKVMKELFGEPEDPEEAEDFQSGELKPDQLAEMGIEAEPGDSYGSVQIPILKRVIVRGVIRAQQTVEDDKVLLVWQFDPRFADSKTHRNTWAPIKRDAAGKKSEGAQQPYGGTGGYLIVNQLPEVEGACFVESHMVIHEPADWFSSSNQLRSKMPILIQESVRSFRRKLTTK